MKLGFYDAGKLSAQLFYRALQLSPKQYARPKTRFECSHIGARANDPAALLEYPPLVINYVTKGTRVSNTVYGGIDLIPWKQMTSTSMRKHQKSISWQSGLDCLCRISQHSLQLSSRKVSKVGCKVAKVPLAWIVVWKTSKVFADVVVPIARCSHLRLIKHF